MILNGCFVNSRVPNLVVRDSRPCGFRSQTSTIAKIPHSGKKIDSLIDRNFLGPFHKNGSASLGICNPLFPRLPKCPRLPLLPPRASSDTPRTFRYPPMTKKPGFFWRTLSAVPYLLPLHETWMFAQTAFYLAPFLEDLKYACYPFLCSLGRLPSWFLLAYFFAAYLGVVRLKIWPHFFRFHVVNGLLLEIGLQTIGLVSRWMPRGLYRGKIGMHFWAGVGMAFFFTVLECIRCCLAGIYADIPFVNDAAYIQIPY
ncbi:Protein TIC 20-I- chloroplastic [Striga hermonthica]|uniref:Protein TIC 20 n=1 Tax=Striga hermonthica TaxID=68872 RepID=A0A9N7NML6_STRHE|nr:Protein TIC 20-I- chloroplastic [Striga hermonthica]